MRADIVNSFIEGMMRFFRQELAVTCQKKSVSLQHLPVTWHQVNVLVDLRGAIEATIIYGMEEDTAWALRNAFCKGRSLQEHCYETEDLLRELFNIVSGQTIRILESKNLACIMPRPPFIVKGRLHPISVVHCPLLVILWDTSVGMVRMGVSIVDNDNKDK